VEMRLARAPNIFVGKPQRNRPRQKPRHVWDVNMKTDITEIGCDGRTWIELVGIGYNRVQERNFLAG
jgi:hypothetical protein